MNTNVALLNIFSVRQRGRNTVKGLSNTTAVKYERKLGARKGETNGMTKPRHYPQVGLSQLAQAASLVRKQMIVSAPPSREKGIESSHTLWPAGTQSTGLCPDPIVKESTSE